MSWRMIPLKRTPRYERILRALKILLVIAVLVCLVVDAGGYGSESIRRWLNWFYVFGALAFVVLEFTGLLRSTSRGSYLREHAAEFACMGVIAGLVLLGFAFGWPARFFSSGRVGGLTAEVRLYVVIVAAIVLVRGFQLLTSKNFRPAPLMISSFAAIILLGTFLIASPYATRTGKSLPVIDALFTSTSATCVTGLIVRDTGEFFSLRGQIVILSLIQAGGLGIMTFTTFFALVLGKGMGMREAQLMTDVLDAPKLGTVGRLVVYILLFTVAVEAAGALLLYAVYARAAWPIPGGRVWSSVFHSISSFCNAGFSLSSDSFMRWAADGPMICLVSALIIIGGLGFTVNQNIMSVLAGRFRRGRRGGFLPKLTGRSSERLGLQTKIVLTTSAALILLGAFGLLLADSQGAIGSARGTERWLTAFFQSVTARTAGFNTVDINSLDQASKFQLIILMFIGASPGSTGGGIKTVTFAVLLLSIVAIARGDTEVCAFRRTLPRAIVTKALAVIVVSLGFVLLATLALSIAEAPKRYDLIRILFETVSAFGTVGLSTGITKDLSTAGKIVIIITMFVGRLGPLTMVLAMGERARRRSYDYPEEKVMIG